MQGVLNRVPETLTPPKRTAKRARNSWRVSGPEFGPENLRCFALPPLPCSGPIKGDRVSFRRVEGWRDRAAKWYDLFRDTIDETSAQPHERLWDQLFKVMSCRVLCTLPHCPTAVYQCPRMYTYTRRGPLRRGLRGPDFVREAVW